MNGPDAAAHTADHKRIAHDLMVLRGNIPSQRARFVPSIRTHLWNLNTSAASTGKNAKEHINIATRMINKYLKENEQITIESLESNTLQE
ncbi:MAG: hypothetical protein AAB492_03160 [Patescibacteria group bacterium]